MRIGVMPLAKADGDAQQGSSDRDDTGRKPVGGNPSPPGPGVRATACLLISTLFLGSLAIFQLPISTAERLVSAIFSPFQPVMFTNRQYRMYAPNPRPRKLVPQLALVGRDNTVSVDLRRSHLLMPRMNWIAAEKWSNFMVYLARDLTDHDVSRHRRAAAEASFHRLAAEICKRDDLAELFPGTDTVVRVNLLAEEVYFGKAMMPPQRFPARTIREHNCTDA